MSTKPKFKFSSIEGRQNQTNTKKTSIAKSVLVSNIEPEQAKLVLNEKELESDQDLTNVQHSTEFFSRRVRLDNLCVFDLSGSCKNYCKGMKTHPEQSYPYHNLFRKIVKNPWFLPEFKTTLHEMADFISEKAFPEIQEIRPFIKTCIYAIIGQKKCENWREHRLVEMPIIFGDKTVNILICHGQPFDWGKDAEKRVFCGLHFDISYLPLDRSHQILDLHPTDKPLKTGQRNNVYHRREKEVNIFETVPYDDNLDPRLQNSILDKGRKKTEVQSPTILPTNDEDNFPSFLKNDGNDKSDKSNKIDDSDNVVSQIRIKSIPKVKTAWDKKNYKFNKNRFLKDLEKDELQRSSSSLLNEEDEKKEYVRVYHDLMEQFKSLSSEYDESIQKNETLKAENERLRTEITNAQGIIDDMRQTQNYLIPKGNFKKIGRLSPIDNIPSKTNGKQSISLPSSSSDSITNTSLGKDWITLSKSSLTMPHTQSSFDPFSMSPILHPTLETSTPSGYNEDDSLWDDDEDDDYEYQNSRDSIYKETTIGQRMRVTEGRYN